METSFVSCLFYKITVSGQCYMLHIYDATEGVLDRCCFAEISSDKAVYATGIRSAWCLPNASLNSTVTVKYQGTEAPFWGGEEDLTQFYNNNSHSITTSIRSCYCGVRSPQNKDDASCFFSGSSCTGPFPADFSSDVRGSVVSKFNFVNNSDSSGYFRIYYQNVKNTIKESVISFNSNPAKWMLSASSGSGMVIEDTFVISNGPPHADQCVSTFDVRVVIRASTYSQFKRHPGRKECNSISKDFSYSLLSYFLFPFPLLSLTILSIAIA